MAEDLYSALYLKQTIFSAKQIIHIMLGIVKGMQYLLKQGLVHADLKTENILLKNQHNPKIADFGLVMKYPSHLEYPQHKLQEVVLGTCNYRAPEVFDWQFGLLKQGQKPFWKFEQAEYEPQRNARKKIKINFAMANKMAIFSTGLIAWELAHHAMPFWDPHSNYIYSEIQIHIFYNINKQSLVTLYNTQVKFIKQCLKRKPGARPSFLKLEEELVRLSANPTSLFLNANNNKENMDTNKLLMKQA